MKVKLESTTKLVQVVLRDSDRPLSTTEISEALYRTEDEWGDNLTDPANHCPSCTCRERAFGRFNWIPPWEVYPRLDRLARLGALEKVKYPHLRPVFWRVVEAEEAFAQKVDS